MSQRVSPTATGHLSFAAACLLRVGKRPPCLAFDVACVVSDRNVTSRRARFVFSAPCIRCPLNGTTWRNRDERLRLARVINLLSLGALRSD